MVARRDQENKAASASAERLLTSLTAHMTHKGVQGPGEDAQADAERRLNDPHCPSPHPLADAEYDPVSAVLLFWEATGLLCVCMRLCGCVFVFVCTGRWVNKRRWC